MLDLYEKETDEALARLPGTKTPDVGVFDGFFRGAAMGAVRTAIKTVARPVAMVGSLGAMVYDNNTTPVGWDAIADGTSARDRYFKAMDEIFDPAIDYWTPKAGEVGVAGEVVGQLLGLLPIVVASPAAAVAGTYMDTAAELSKKGVSDWRAQAVGAAQAAGLGLGIWMPILGSTLAQRVLVGGAGFNAVQGIVTRGAAEELLKGHPAGEEFKALDGTALTLDVLLGMAFGTIAHLSPAQRSQGAKAWEQIGKWADNLQPSEKASIMVLREAQHLNADSLAGRPVTPADIDAHVQRVKTAMEQILRDEPVNVDAMPKPVLEADPKRFVEADKRAEVLVKEGDKISKAEGFAQEEPVVVEPKTEAEPAKKTVVETVPPEAGKEVDHVSVEAQKFAEERPDLPMRTGQDANGDPVTKPLKAYLDDARLDVEQARKDAKLFEVAAACLLGVS